MFIWFNSKHTFSNWTIPLNMVMAVHLNNHPRYKQLSERTSPSAAKNTLATELWTNLVNAKVIFRRGELFAVEDDEERVRLGEHVAYMRASFSSGAIEDLQRAMSVFATTLVDFFN
jgi:hypothetical protein